jgi:hypothetical protein
LVLRLTLEVLAVRETHRLLLLVLQWLLLQQLPVLLGRRWQLQRCLAASRRMRACRRIGSSTCSSGHRCRVAAAFRLTMQVKQRLQPRLRQLQLQVMLVLA